MAHAWPLLLADPQVVVSVLWALNTWAGRAVVAAKLHCIQVELLSCFGIPEWQLTLATGGAAQADCWFVFIFPHV